MPSTIFADVSYYQPVVNDSYPHKFFSFRSNDGTFRDPHFSQNIAWAKHACDTGRLAGFMTYYVFEPGIDSVSVLKDMTGKPHSKQSICIDVESWGGKITGNHSAAIKAEREQIIKWLGSYMTPLARLLKKHRKRVVIYGNRGDLNSLCPDRGDAKIILASYGSNPPFPNKMIHQFADNYVTPPFGACDANSADGLTSSQLATALGLGVDKPVTYPVPKGVKWVEMRPGTHGTFAGPARMKLGTVLYSPDRKHKLKLNAAGCLLIERKTKTGWLKIWSSHSMRLGVDRLSLQYDGNLVLYRGETRVWSTRTVGSKADRLVMQNDGNLVLYAGRKPVWSTKTNGK